MVSKFQISLASFTLLGSDLVIPSSLLLLAFNGGAGFAGATISSGNGTQVVGRATLSAGTYTVWAANGPAGTQSNNLGLAVFQSQAISFGPLNDVTLGTAAFTLAATASSGLPVSFASTPTSVCAVSGATVTVIAAGTCTITASQAGDATFAAAPNVSRSFPVTSPASCDINLDGNVNVSDVQLIINEALGVSPSNHDLNHDGSVNVADVQKVINAALGLGCVLP